LGIAEKEIDFLLATYDEQDAREKRKEYAARWPKCRTLKKDGVV